MHIEPRVNVPILNDDDLRELVINRYAIDLANDPLFHKYRNALPPLPVTQTKEPDWVPDYLTTGHIPLNKPLLPESKTEVLDPSLVQIPYEGLEALGYIFAEGQAKYGRDNWKSNQTPEYIEERTNHAIRHLMLWANGDRSEAHLAKVAWYCVTTIWGESKKNCSTTSPIKE